MISFDAQEEKADPTRNHPARSVVLLSMADESRELVVAEESIIKDVLTAAVQVHRDLGPGLLESVYELAMCCELESLGLPFRRQVDIPVRYRGKMLGMGFRADVVVANSLLLELKSVQELATVDILRVTTYLEFIGFRRGLILNFNRELMKYGIKRVSIGT